MARLLAPLQPALRQVATCPRCNSDRLGRWGTTRRGLQRWRCRACRRTCTAATGTPLAHLHSLDKLHLVAADMLAAMPRSCRALAAALGLDRMTTWRWRRLVGKVWAAHALRPATSAPAAAGATTVVLRESRKASREWVRHRRDPTRHPPPDRLRWIDYRQGDLPLPQPMSRYRVVVPLPPRTTGTDPVTSDGGRPVAAWTKAPTSGTRPAHHHPAARSVKPARPRRADDALSAAPSAPPAARFLAFLGPFCGPATRHLGTYLAWFEARRAVRA